MNDKDRLQLQQMLKANDFEDQTSKIRTLKHSELIKNDVSKLAKIWESLGYIRRISTN